MTPDQAARAMSALNTWYSNPSSDYRAPGVTWDAHEVEAMHAALEAPNEDAALEAFGVADPTLSTPVQYARNCSVMAALRQQEWK